MVVKRMQGRPPRGSGASGRDKLIEATRAYLRSRRKLSLTRTEIAEGCGVTPALISYYFKEKGSLLHAVTKPLISACRIRLSGILDAPTPPAIRIRSVVELLLELNAENGSLVDHLMREIEAKTLGTEERLAFAVFHDEVIHLIEDLMVQGHWKHTDPAFAWIALWGMCRAFGDSSLLQAVEFDVSELPSLEKRIDHILDAFALETEQPGMRETCSTFVDDDLAILQQFV